MKHIKKIVPIFFMILIFLIYLKFKIPDFKMTYYKNGQKVQLDSANLKKTKSKQLKKKILEALNSADDTYLLLIPKTMFDSTKKCDCIEIEFSNFFFVFSANLLHDTKKIFIILDKKYEDVLFIGNNKGYYSAVGYNKNKTIYPELKEYLLEVINNEKNIL